MSLVNKSFLSIQIVFSYSTHSSSRVCTKKRPFWNDSDLLHIVNATNGFTCPSWSKVFSSTLSNQYICLGTRFFTRYSNLYDIVKQTRSQVPIIYSYTCLWKYRLEFKFLSVHVLIARFFFTNISKKSIIKNDKSHTTRERRENEWVNMIYHTLMWKKPSHRHTEKKRMKDINHSFRKEKNICFFFKESHMLKEDHHQA